MDSNDGMMEANVAAFRALRVGLRDGLSGLLTGDLTSQKSRASEGRTGEKLRS